MKTIVPGIPALTQMFGTRPHGKPQGVLYYPNAGMEPTSDHRLDDTAELYCGRGLGMLRYADAAAMSQKYVAPQKELIKHLNDIGVSTFQTSRIFGIPEIPEGPPRLSNAFVRELLRENSPLAAQIQTTDVKILLPYIFETNTDIVARKLELTAGANADTTHLVNHKWITKQALAAMGVPVPLGRKITTVKEAYAAFNDLITISGKDKRASGNLFAKLNRSAAGRGVTKLENRKDFEKWIKNTQVFKTIQNACPALANGACLDVGVKLRKTNPYPNLIIYVSPEKDDHLYINSSYQLLENGTNHVGNKGPLRSSDFKRIMPHADKIAAWMHHMGATGLAGIDFVMGADENPYFMEINFRMNASTTAAMIASLYEAPRWMYGKIRVKKGTDIRRAIRHLTHRGILFNGKSGVIIINALPALHGRNFIQGVFLATNDTHLKRIYNQAQIL